MATLLLQAVGASLGGAFGATGAILGQAAGALAGNLIDNALFSTRRTVQGARLSNAAPFNADEGSPLPRVYGTVRVPGLMIWATRFEEVVQTERRGAKAMGGGTKVRTSRYFANVAFALCEGPIAGVRRVWADGRELDLTGIDLRIYTGLDDQAADPLILAKQGADNTPAYRGVAYAVLERLALEPFGNRVPQLQFEVMRPVGALERNLRAVTIIPGSTEFAYEPEALTDTPAPGASRYINRHVLHAGSDWQASLDELQALCPKLEHVALVVSWFGDDLRAGHCTIKPGVVEAVAPGETRAWRGGGLSRDQARLVSRAEGKASYGGTPDDASVIRAIRDLKARGLKVTLYPFVMLDIPPGNSLPDPYGAAAQSAHPWRGRITCHPAEGVAGSPFGGAAAATQVAAFLGGATPQQFSHAGDMIQSTASDWGYRRFVFHCAALARAAGGVDAFLIGSELKGLTGIQGAGGSHPFVAGLMALAGDVRSMLGAGTKLTYAADWTEYSGFRPKATPGDIRYHLDPLWAHPDIDAVGIDWYAPISDWRDTDWEGAGPDGAAGPHDADALLVGITSGEGHDWHYADEAARAARQRTPITDGAYAKPWVWRVKALRQWWENRHFDRVNGIEASTASPWVPRSKPIWLTEVGCPAVDKGAGQPNVFPDPKSSESALPHFSNGSRDDVIQRLYLEAHQRAFDAAHPLFDGSHNPLTGLYGGRMLDASRCFAWAWDARPFPAFPVNAASWGDGRNWLTGHWLNGRLGGAAVRDLIVAVFLDHGLTPPKIGSIAGWLDGFLVARPEAARETLEPVLNLFGVVAAPGLGHWLFRDARALAASPLTVDAVVADDEHGGIRHARAARSTVPNEAILTTADPMNNHEPVSSRAHVAGSDAVRQTTLSLAASLDASSADAAVSRWLERAREEAASVRFGLPNAHAGLAPGDALRLPGDARLFRIERITAGDHLQIEARLHAAGGSVHAPQLPEQIAISLPVVGRPAVILMDLPVISGDGSAPRLTVAAHAAPWRAQAVLLEAAGRLRDAGRIHAPAVAGVMLDPVPPADTWRFVGGGFRVRLHQGALASAPKDAVLAGANLAAVRSSEGAWEIMQFATAEEIEPEIWRISDVLRGQGGTEDACSAGAPSGAAFVMLDAAPAEIAVGNEGTVSLRIGPASKSSDDPAWGAFTHRRPERSLLPPAPVHLRCRSTLNGDAQINWVRRGRIDADDWEQAEIPLGEDVERYGWTISALSGATLRRGTAGMPALTYSATDRAADLGSATAPFVFTVWQEGRLAGRGLHASLTVD